MNRYAFYLFWTDILIMGTTFLSNLLIADRFTGGIMAVLLCAIPGMIFVITLSKSMGYFPKQGLPEIFSAFLPSWVRVPLLIFFSIMIITKGCLILGLTAFFLNRFLLPQNPTTYLVVVLFLASAWGATRSSKTVLTVIEIVLCLAIPLNYYVIIKTLFDKGIEWNAVKEMTDYILILPSFTSLAIANSIFSGFVGLIVFNRIVPSKINWKFAILIIALSLQTLVFGFIVPVGMLGTYGAGNYANPFFSALDSMGLGFGLFERAITFILLSLLLGWLTYAMVTFHVGVELLKGCFSLRLMKSSRREGFLSWPVLIFFSVSTLICFYILNEKQIYFMIIKWLEVRFFTELLLVALVAWLALLKRRNSL